MTSLLIVFSLFMLSSGFGVLHIRQHPDLEEPDFEQCIVHPVVTNGTPFDPVPFKPYKVIVDLPPKVAMFANCSCGVHDFVEDWQRMSNPNRSVVVEPWVDGTPTDKNQFPFIVALIYRNKNKSTHFCGGTLLTSKLVITATHCLIGKTPEKTEVWLNERDLLLSTETDHPTLKIKVKRFLPHPEYNPLMNYNDISLLELSEFVDVQKSHLRPICLPHDTIFEPTEVVSFGYTAGWGQSQFNGPKSDHLRHVKVPLLTNKACNDESEPYYRGRVTTHMICAGDLALGGPDACPGDSGGPLFIKYRERYRLIGIVSWGERCSEPRKPSVYSRVSKYLRWIKKIKSEAEQNVECEDE